MSFLRLRVGGRERETVPVARLPSFTEFYRVLPSFTEFYRVSLMPYEQTYCI